MAQMYTTAGVVGSTNKSLFGEKKRISDLFSPNFGEYNNGYGVPNKVDVSKPPPALPAVYQRPEYLPKVASSWHPKSIYNTEPEPPEGFAHHCINAFRTDHVQVILRPGDMYRMHMKGHSMPHDLNLVAVGITHAYLIAQGQKEPDIFTRIVKPFSKVNDPRPLPQPRTFYSPTVCLDHNYIKVLKVRQHSLDRQVNDSDEWWAKVDDGEGNMAGHKVIPGFIHVVYDDYLAVFVVPAPSGIRCLSVSRGAFYHPELFEQPKSKEPIGVDVAEGPTTK